MNEISLAVSMAQHFFKFGRWLLENSKELVALSAVPWLWRIRKETILKNRLSVATRLYRPISDLKDAIDFRTGHSTHRGNPYEQGEDQETRFAQQCNEFRDHMRPLRPRAELLLGPSTMSDVDELTLLLERLESEKRVMACQKDDPNGALRAERSWRHFEKALPSMIRKTHGRLRFRLEVVLYGWLTAWMRRARWWSAERRFQKMKRQINRPAPPVQGD